MSASEQAFLYAIYPSLKGKRVVITGGGSGIGAGSSPASCARAPR
jgi:FlaA1/EpsC-like NDP-sugar epimerase